MPWLARVRAGGGEPLLKSVSQVVCGLVFRFGHTVLVRRDRSQLLRALSSFISAGAGRLTGLGWHCKRYQASLWQGTPGVHSGAIRPKGNRAAPAWQSSWHHVFPQTIQQPLVWGTSFGMRAFCSLRERTWQCSSVCNMLCTTAHCSTMSSCYTLWSVLHIRAAQYTSR